MSAIKLSAAELSLACDAGVLLTKNSIIDKVYELFGNLSDFYKKEIQQHAFPAEVLQLSPKISKGENYQGLPWVMLDFPRYYTAENIFAIRTMFWWGRYFSHFIILKGEYFLLPDKTAISQLQKDKWFICINKDPFQHHFEESNMMKINNLTQEDINRHINNVGFLKLGTKIPISQWESVEIWAENNFKQMLEIASV